MLVFHQKSIEQLQETLRQKVLSEENWREKVTPSLPGSFPLVSLFFIPPRVVICAFPKH